MHKKFFLAIIIFFIIIGGGYYLYSQKDTVQKKDIYDKLEKIKADHPELSEQVNDVLKWQKIIEEDPNLGKNYLGLGLAWKSLGEWAKNINLEKNKEYFKKSLETYEKGIEVTKRKNTVMIMNAGNLALILENYEQAEDYYKEAITISPGELSYYIKLAELYEYKMDKLKEEVIKVYDEGISRVLDFEYLEKRKESYLERVSNN